MRGKKKKKQEVKETKNKTKSKLVFKTKKKKNLACEVGNPNQIGPNNTNSGNKGGDSYKHGSPDQRQWPELCKIKLFIVL